KSPLLYPSELQAYIMESIVAFAPHEMHPAPRPFQQVPVIFDSRLSLPLSLPIWTCGGKCLHANPEKLRRNSWCHSADSKSRRENPVGPKNPNELTRRSLFSSSPFPEIAFFPSSDKVYNPDSITSSKRGRIRMDWPRLLAYITGTVDQELLLRNEY